ncbi:MAG: protein-glutamate methylesterase/protein-glutamine glutaminase [Candidatus Anammoxibacter sp.]
MIKVLIVDDSQVVRDLLSHIFSSDPEINVIGTASNGKEAVEVANEKKPDVITMDIIMPKMDGFEATRIIMETNPVPIVIVSASWDPDEVKKTFKAIDAGAVSAMEKPVGLDNPNYKDGAKELVQIVKVMSEVKVVKRHPRYRKKKIPPVALTPSETVLRQPSADIKTIKAIAIGASTGGPQVLKIILSELAGNFPVPVLIVQHMAEGFVKGFIDWLNEVSAIPVMIAKQGDTISSGRAYVAPEGFHLTVSKDYRIKLSKDLPENFVRPSVSCLFRSVLEVYGAGVIGVLLTGMGKDGAKELKLMRQNGSITIAQDKESSVVHGMPGEAIKLGAASHVLSQDKIAATLNVLVNSKTNQNREN